MFSSPPVQDPPDPVQDPVSVSDALVALIDADPVSGSVSQSSSSDHVSLGASWVEGNVMPRFTARYGNGSTWSFSEDGPGWAPLEDTPFEGISGGNLIHEPFQGASLSRRVGARTLTISAYSDVVTKSIQLGSYDDGTADFGSGAQLYHYSNPGQLDTANRKGFITHWARHPDGRQGRFYCKFGQCRVTNGVISGQVSFTPNRPPQAQDVTDNDTIRWFGGNFAARLGEHSMWKLPGTLNGVEGFFRCTGNTGCGSGGENRHGETEAYTSLSGDWIFVPASLSVRSNPDYLVFGNWLIEPDDTLNGVHESGLYATGTNPFDYTKVAAVEGTADYYGAVVGTASYKKGDNTVSSRMTGNAQLYAHFGNQEEFGGITAWFKDLSTDFFGGGEVIFRYSDITSAGDSGQNFTFGSSSVESSRIMISSDETIFGSLNAQWNGKFYGISANGKKPGGIAGLLTATQSAGTKSLSLSGSFGVYCFSNCGNFSRLRIGAFRVLCEMIDTDMSFLKTIYWVKRSLKSRSVLEEH